MTIAGHARDALTVARAHPRHVAVFGLVAGLLAGVAAPPALPLVAACAAWSAGSRVPAVAAALAVLLGGALADARRSALDDGRLPAVLGSPVTLELALLEPLRARTSGGHVARVRVGEGWAAGETLLLRLPRDARPPAAVATGEIVRVDGTLERLRPWEEFQRRRGALAVLHARSIAPTGRVRGGPDGVLDAVRRRAERALSAGLPPREAALVRGMVLGQDEAVPAEMREAFRASGLAHLLAASGMNVMLLAMLVLAAGAVVGAPLRARIALALVLVALYVPIAGAGPSIQRAGVMGVAGLVAALAGRPASRWYAVGLAAAVTLGLNPYAAGEPGWQLSFAAVIGLMAWVPGIRLALRGRRVPAAVAEPAAVTLAATLATAPLLALHFGSVSVVSLPANLLAVPAVAPVMWLGTVAGLLGQVAPFAPLSWTAGLFASWIGLVADSTARIPMATLEVPFSSSAAAAAYLAMALVPVAWRRRRTVRRAAVGRTADRWLPHLVAAGAAIAVCALALVPDRGRAEPLAPGETRVSFLDVGQGDATLVERGATAMLVDTGPPGGPLAEELVEAGVRRLDVLVLTHAQADHEGEALEVLRRFRPRLVVNGGAGWPTAVQRQLPAAARAVGSRVVPAAGGDALRFAGLEATVLWPPRALAESPPQGDPNDRALVAHLTAGALDVLLTADAESDVTGSLRLPRVDVLKVAHHGSADEGLPAFLERTRPVVAAIMAGRGNRYGHPAPSTMAALAGVPVVRRTDRHGTVRVRAVGGGLTVETDGGGLR